MQRGASTEKEYDQKTWKAEGFKVVDMKDPKPVEAYPLKSKDAKEWWMTSGHDSIISDREQEAAKANELAKKKDKEEKDKKKKKEEDI